MTPKTLLFAGTLPQARAIIGKAKLLRDQYGTEVRGIVLGAFVDNGSVLLEVGPLKNWVEYHLDEKGSAG